MWSFLFIQRMNRCNLYLYHILYRPSNNLWGSFWKSTNVWSWKVHVTQESKPKNLPVIYTSTDEHRKLYLYKKKTLKIKGHCYFSSCQPRLHMEADIKQLSVPEARGLYRTYRIAHWGMLKTYKHNAPHTPKGNLRTRQAKRKHIACGFNFQNVIAKKMSNDRQNCFQLLSRRQCNPTNQNTNSHLTVKYHFQPHLIMVSQHMTFKEFKWLSM